MAEIKQLRWNYNPKHTQTEPFTHTQQYLRHQFKCQADIKIAERFSARKKNSEEFKCVQQKKKKIASVL